ncbi:hypothetical protein F5884DRAFT_775662 [Xylogone sp. PMI_703]|nr:hypothetical protein F5884DRAFT_775662 [Xylogone sp. PMI_703]
MPVQPSSIRRAWFKWKALRLPWRKKFLVGFDLQGNTFWEFRDVLSQEPQRMRRIAQFPSSVPYSDISISPQWHQWLRYTRQSPPSLNEQSNDITRLETLKVLAAEADRRWAAKPRLLDHPEQAAERKLPPSNSATNLKGQEHAISPSDTLNKSTQNGSGRPRENSDGDVDKTPLRGTKAPSDVLKKRRDSSRDEWQPSSWEGNVTGGRR